MENLGPVSSENTFNLEFRLHKVDEDDDEEKLDRESHNAYFWGDITSEEAEKKLENNHPGTFLLRQNGDLFKLSWISFNKRNYHAHITEQLGFFALGNRRFRTLCELVTFRQNQPHNFKNALGRPLINPKYEENKTEEEKDLERNDSRKRNMAGFHGNVTAKAAESMLQKERDASYLVRKSPGGKFFISYRHNNMVHHLPIEEKDKKYTIKFPDKEGGIIIATSLRRLVENSKDKGLFLYPLHSDSIDIKQQSIEGIFFQKWRESAEKLKRESLGLGITKAPPKMASIVEQLRNSENPPLSDVESEQEEEKEREEKEDKFVYNISRNEAKGLLSDKEKGAWILYYNKNREERLSFKEETKVTHIKLYRRDGGIAVHSTGGEVFRNLEQLISRLQEDGKLKTQLTEKDIIGNESDEDEEKTADAQQAESDD